MRALIAMSGGVDSSVAALIMKERGYDCVGCTMRLYENDMIGEDLLSACCSAKDTGDARAVCERLGIPYHIFHYENEFRKEVIEPFVCSYERGETPNPCIECNRRLKFGILYEKALELDCQFIVTGHYARIVENNGIYSLKKALDLSKDQSYVLYSMGQTELAHTLFPLGELTKTQVRQIAAEHGFINSGKKDSQDICFVPDGDYAAMIKRYRKDMKQAEAMLPESGTAAGQTPGDFTDINGRVLGTHEGIINYTIGQRRGLGLPTGDRIYVYDIDPDENTVILSDDRTLYKREFTADKVCWVGGAYPAADASALKDAVSAAGNGTTSVTGDDNGRHQIRALVKIRYRHREQPAVIESAGDGTVRVTFDEPQRAITPGQAAVFYDTDGETVLGGGVIRRDRRSE